MIKHLINITDARTIRDNMKREFNSHMFIRKFYEQHHEEYQAIQECYPTDAIRITNSLIARFLSANQRELGIEKVENRKSRSINQHNNQTSCALWRKNS